jgi:hypothetical protein
MWPSGAYRLQTELIAEGEVEKPAAPPELRDMAQAPAQIARRASVLMPDELEGFRPPQALCDTYRFIGTVIWRGRAPCAVAVGLRRGLIADRLH